jgi:hypothetical protein
MISSQSHSTTRDAILSWLLDNLDSNLAVCAGQLGFPVQAAVKLVMDDMEFQSTLVNRWKAQRAEPCSNPPCPMCGGASARVTYGYPLMTDEMSLRWLLPILAKEATWSHGCVLAGERWECNVCRHEWGDTATTSRGE